MSIAPDPIPMENIDYQSVIDDLRRQLAEKEEEIQRMEIACIALPTFDPNGPGDCADRQIAAITQLSAENERIKSLITSLRDQYIEEVQKLSEGDRSLAFKTAALDMAELLKALPTPSPGQKVEELEVCHYCQLPKSDHPRCQKCGYTYCDCRHLLDHGLCGQPEPLPPKAK